MDRLPFFMNLKIIENKHFAKYQIFPLNLVTMVREAFFRNDRSVGMLFREICLLEIV